MAIKTIDDTHLKQIANAIREKTGSVEGIGVDEMPEQIKGIKGGGIDLPELITPGTAADLLSGRQLIDGNGNVTTGTMPNNGAISSTMNGVDTKSVSIPAGYTSGGTVGLDDTIDNELDTQAALLEEIMTTLESKAAPDSGGGVSVEMCNGIIVVDAPNMEDFSVYALNSSLVAETISIDGMMGGTFSVAKGTIVAVTPWTTMDRISGECVKCFGSYNGAAFLVNGDFTLTFA